MYKHRVNNCIGYRNYRWFLSFLLSHSLFTAYGGGVFYSLLNGVVEKHDLWNAEFINSQTQEPVKPDIWVIIRFLMQHYTSLAYVLILCITMSLLLGLFFIVHVRQASQGFTTN